MGYINRENSKQVLIYKDLSKSLAKENSFHYFWDDSTAAPYLYNTSDKLFATYDDKRSIRLKTNYVLDQRLQGIMFWELTLDTYSDGLLSEIDHVKKTTK